MLALRYLTVQDVLWINLRLTGGPQKFRVLDLEEAAFNQYAHGESKDLVSHATRFLTGFLKKRPFEEGSEATAFVAVIAFTFLNGYKLELTDAEAAAWLQKIAKSDIATEEMAEVVEPDSDASEKELPDVKSAVDRVFETYPRTILKLSEADVAA